MDTQNSTFRRARVETRTREVDHTVNGVTRTVLENYAVHVPVPPRDWDRIVRAGVTAATAATVTAAIAWGTASIGDLLAVAVHPAIAYGAAGAFDLAWITCMATEWLARYDRRKAEFPRRAGHLALALAMAAICTHGVLAGGQASVAVGIIGSAVSALAKGLWHITMQHHSTELDPRSQQWVEQQMSEAHARLAVAAVQRELARVEGQAADYAAAYAPATKGPDPDKPSSGQPNRHERTVRSAVRAAIETMPDASADDIVEQLARIGIDTDADTVQALSGQPDNSSGAVLALAPHDPDETITATVRRAVRTVGHDADKVLAAVRRVHGQDVRPDTVSRLIKRVG